MSLVKEDTEWTSQFCWWLLRTKCAKSVTDPGLIAMNERLRLGYVYPAVITDEFVLYPFVRNKHVVGQDVAGYHSSTEAFQIAVANSRIAKES